MSDENNALGEAMEDDALLAELRALAVEHDPVPPEAVAAARSALAWRTMDAELAELVADSSVDSGDLALVRGADTPTLLTFESGGLTMEVEVEAQGGARRIMGQLLPATSGEVTVHHRAGTTTVPADERGRFRADGIAAGPVRLRCAAGTLLVATDWFLA